MVQLEDQPAARDAEHNSTGDRGGCGAGHPQWAMRMTYRVNVVGKPKVGRKLSGMGATRRDPTWYGADYAPPLLHQRSSGLVVARQELGAIQGSQGTEPLQLGGGHRGQVTPLVDMPPMEADMASEEDEGWQASHRTMRKHLTA